MPSHNLPRQVVLALPVLHNYSMSECRRQTLNDAERQQIKPAHPCDTMQVMHIPRVHAVAVLTDAGETSHSIVQLVTLSL